LKFGRIRLVEENNAPRIEWDVFRSTLRMYHHARNHIWCDDLVDLQAAQLRKYLGAMNVLISQWLVKGA